MRLVRLNLHLRGLLLLQLLLMLLVAQEGAADALNKFECLDQIGALAWDCEVVQWTLLLVDDVRCACSRGPLLVHDGDLGVNGLN